MYDSSGVFARLLTQPFTAPLLGAVLEHDFDTHRHLLNVAALGVRTALAAGFAADDALCVGQAGLFHDVGKLRWPRALLNDGEELSRAGWDVVRAHPEHGAAMLVEHGAADLAVYVLDHHERLDGSGYPRGLRGLAIADGTRVLSVVDAYDALRAGRPYAMPVTHDVALDRLAGARRQYDPDAVAALVRALGVISDRAELAGTQR